MPISALYDIGEQVNDYDYCLVHLAESNQKYYNYYKYVRDTNRDLILDNSIFELGVAFSGDKYADYIAKLEPTIWICPDVLDDAEATKDSTLEFAERYSELPGLKMGVVQGKTFEEMLGVYDVFLHDPRIDVIGISFDSKAYINECVEVVPEWGERLEDPDRSLLLQVQSVLRPEFIARIMENNFVPVKPIHLLGISQLSEMRSGVYSHPRVKHIVRSIDTSNPVVAGLQGDPYLDGWGMVNKKPHTKLADLIDTKVTTKQALAILRNCKIFREVIASI